MGVVAFDYSLWAATYPQLAPKVPEPLAARYFAQATLYLDNTDCSIVEDVAQRAVLLDMIVAHIASLNGASPAGAAGLVGRISSVTEGSVTISADMPTATAGSEAWYNQTPYGAAYWAATVGYRSGFYVPGPVPSPIDASLGARGVNRWPY